MLAFLSNSLTELVDSTVSGGYLLALAFICLLQYIVHLHYRHRTRTLADRRESDYEQLAGEFAVLRRDRSLARQEILLVRQFVEQPDWDKSVAALLKKFSSGSPIGFAAFFRNHNGVPALALQCGLSSETCERICLDAQTLARLPMESLLSLSGSALHKTRLWSTLCAIDRRKTETCHFAALGDVTNPVGWLLTTSLLPADGTMAEQQQFTTRLLSSIAPVLRDRMRMAAQDDHLRSSSEMLTMRALLDQQWESPAQMLEELLSHATAMMDADRGALFLHAADSALPLKSLIRTGTVLPAGVREAWNRSEEILAQAALDRGEAFCADTVQLHRLHVRSLIGAALLIPLCRASTVIGVVCLTRRETGPFTERDLRHAEWVGQLFAETIPRLGSQAAAERQARLDGLTGLANRAAFDRQFAADLDSARQRRAVCSLLLLDLDRFKSINDQYGHLAGDEVLRQAAAVVQECTAGIRINDRFAVNDPLAARYGGEELALWVPGADERTARRLAEDCRIRIESLQPEVNGREIPVTTSIGIATYPEDGTSPDELFAAADAALYEAKASGRNQVCVASTVAAVPV